MPSPINEVPESPENERLSARLANLSPAQRELLKKKLALRAAADSGPRESAQPTDQSDRGDATAIAIVGMGCRFPGANSLDEFWDLIQRGGEAVGPIPAERWERERFFDPTGRSLGKMSVDAMGAIDRVDEFDPAFFGIAPREAARMDPQQRLLLEVTWETFENAGIPIDSMAGSNTGVFIGIGGTDYSKVPARYPDYFEHIDAHMGTGNALSIAAGRISYIFDFHGPSFIVDTACSSALVAIHSAVTSLLRNESNAAVAGGVNLILSPETTIAFSKARMLSPDGHCRPFDDGANGYVRGEGCGLVLLKRLADAQNDGDKVLGIIRGTAVNQDGRTSGITAPNGESQQRCIESAMQSAGITVDDVTYVEAHGTGTPLGDPIELMSLAKTFSSRKSELAPIRVGSVKANIGHTETASGIAGLIKVLQMFANNEIPAQANFHSLNTNVRLSGDQIRIADRSQSWDPSHDGRVIAGINSFGFGGTNTHLIVEKPSDDADTPVEGDPPPTLCLPLSASDTGAIEELATRLTSVLELGDVNARDLCAASASQRASLAVRAVAVGDSDTELRNALQDFPSLIQGRKPAGRRPRIAMLFTGQGSQYIGMATGLSRKLPAFEKALQRCDAILKPAIGCSLLKVLEGSSLVSIDHTSMAQPAICAVQCAIVDTFKEMQIVPDVVAGHSIGEIAALYAAGAFSLDQALLVAAARGKTMGTLPEGGSMAAIFATADEVATLIQRCSSSAVIATMNGNGNTVIAGSEQAVDTVVELAAKSELAARKLVVSHAFHSPLMAAATEPLRQQLETIFESVSIPSHITFISSVTGKRHQAPVDREYWIRHLLQPVRFTDVIGELNRANLDLAIEVGPSPQLCGMIRRSGTDSGEPVASVPTLDPKQDDFRGWIKSIASAWCVGAPVNWDALEQFSISKRIKFPTYPFQRERFWHHPPTIGSSTSHGHQVHPLLGVQQSLAKGGVVYNAVMRDVDPSYLGEHVVSGSITVPAAAWIEALRAAAHQHLPAGFTLDQIQIERALFLEPSTPVSIQTSVHTTGGSRIRLQIDALGTGDDGEWQTCASAIAMKGVGDITPLESITDSEVIESSDLYQAMSDSKLDYGPFFQVLNRIHSDGKRAKAALRIDSQLQSELEQYLLHPTLLDGALQLIATVVPKQTSERTFLPVGVDRLLMGEGGPITAARVVRLEPTDGQNAFAQIVANVQLLDADNVVVADLQGVRLQSLQRTRKRDDNPSVWLHQVAWSPVVVAEQNEPSRSSSPSLHFGGKKLTQAIGPIADAGDGRPHWIWTMPNSEGSQLDSDAVTLATQSLLDTVQAAIHAEVPPRLSIVTERAFDVKGDEPSCAIAAAVAGLARVAVVEHPPLNIQLLDVPHFAADQSATAACVIEWAESDTNESELAWRDGRFYQPRLTARPRLFAHDEKAEIGIPERGSYRVRLDGTNRTEGLWVERIAPPRAKSGEVSLQISAVGLNFSDVLKSIGLYPGINDEVVPMGIEVCGTVSGIGADVDNLSVGQRVMGIVPYGFASDDATRDYLLVPVPANLNDEEAASIPVVFMTAHHALRNVGRLRAGESVLIHAGAGGVGIAAIQVAQAIGATVFTTAGSTMKRQLLASMGVPPEHIFDSRNVRSIEAIRELTDGRGVDVVLNSLPGEWIDASLALLAAHGRFLEIGKTDIYQNRSLGLLPFQDNLSYSAIDLDRIFRHRGEEVLQLFAEVAENFASGVYQPLPITSFRLDELPAAMRFMAARRNVGKIVVRAPKSAPDITTTNTDGAHLITGGSGAIARGVARRLIQRGATAIALVARRDATEEIDQLCQWAEEQGAKCYYLKADCADEGSLRQALQTLPTNHSRIIGVVHAAGLLDDGLIHELNADSLQRVLHPKVAGAIALDRVTADHPVESFTMLGSIASVFGSPGQGNYAAANAFLEGFAQDRRKRGLPASVVHWGPWGAATTGTSAGMADDPIRIRNLASRGLRPLDFDRAIDLLIDASMKEAPLASVVVDANFSKMLGATALPPSVLRSLKLDGAAADIDSASLIDAVLLTELAPLDSAGRSERLGLFFADQLGTIISMDPESIDPARSLGSLGLDSLMAIELKNTIETKLDISIPISKFMDDPTLESLAEAAAGLIKSINAPSEEIESVSS
ncbi:MAG: type I polyketide synthase [Rubripirellula sp.]